ncbi:MAG TPA: MarR family transcriptional regulator [Acetivibrio clariflavus]|nr:MarR family transcriptional regulator [Acetivibrio clariflavus]
MEGENRGIAVSRLLKEIMVLIKNAHKPCGDMKLTGPQAMLVGIIAHYGEMKISDLSEKMGLSNSTVSGIVDRLEKQGILERIRSKDDRRVVRVNIVSNYRECVKTKFESIEYKMEEIMKEATDEEVNKIFEGLKLLKKLIEENNRRNLLHKE